MVDIRRKRGKSWTVCKLSVTSLSKKRSRKTRTVACPVREQDTVIDKQLSHRTALGKQTPTWRGDDQLRDLVCGEGRCQFETWPGLFVAHTNPVIISVALMSVTIHVRSDSLERYPHCDCTATRTKVPGPLTQQPIHPQQSPSKQLAHNPLTNLFPP